MAPFSKVGLDVKVQYCYFFEPCSPGPGIELVGLPGYHMFYHDGIDVVKCSFAPVVEPAYRKRFAGGIIVKCHFSEFDSNSKIGKSPVIFCRPIRGLVFR